MVNRRDFLKYQGLLGSSILLPSLLTKQAYAGQGIGDLLQCKGNSMPAPEPYQEPLPIPPVLEPIARENDTDWYYIQAQPTMANILPGGYPATPAWGYNGMMLGPTIKAKRNRTAAVNVHNSLPFDPISVHLHGSESPADFDGHPEDLINPNTSKTYYYPNKQPPATLWYHDHRIHLTADQVYAGMAGFYLLEDEEIEQELNLPKGTYDIPLVLQNRELNDDGTLCLKKSHFSGSGPIKMVNGKHQPYLNVARRKYRFRLLNGDNSFNMKLWFAGRNRYGNATIPLDYFIVATDTGYLKNPFHYPITTPYFKPNFWLSPAERVEVVIDFSQLDIGSRAALRTDYGEYLEFRVTHDAVDDSDLPDVLDPNYTTLTQADVTDNMKSRRVNLDLDWNTFIFMLDNKPFGAAQPGEPYGSGFKHIDDIEAGSIERWWFVVRSGYVMPHPMHVHTCRFQITRRFKDDPGDPRVDYENPKSEEIPVEQWSGYFGNPFEQHAWKDTATVSAGFNAVEVLVQFSPHPGTYVYHCHNLHHEDHDMMANMRLI